MTRLDPDDARPAYRQVADDIRAKIESDELTPGAQLPTHRALATEYDVAVETVKRALLVLRAEELVVARQGKGTFVRHTAGETSNGGESVELAARVEALSRELAALKKRIAAMEARNASPPTN